MARVGLGGAAAGLARSPARCPASKRSVPGRSALGGLALGLALLLGAQAARAQRTELVSRTELRVCADPNNLPFSDEAGEGFENRIARLIADDLGLPVAYVWFPQVVGFVRNTLRARQCDLVPGTVGGDGVLDNTNPYYRTAYMVVTRAADGIEADSLADPVFADKRIGVVAATPPSDLLLRHGLMPRVHPYRLAVDTRVEAPARRMLQDLAEGKIDVALVWGPIAGYAIKREGLPLRAVFLRPEPDAPRMDYRVTMGVRPGEPEWRRRVNQALRRKQDAIAAVLAEYGVPVLDEQRPAQDRPAVPVPVPPRP